MMRRGREVEDRFERELEVIACDTPFGLLMWLSIAIAMSMIYFYVFVA
jgi:hypothetical protein